MGDVPPAQVGAFLNGGWLQGKRFPTERNRMGTRQFSAASAAPAGRHQETWWNAQDRAVAAQEGRRCPDRPGSMGGLLDRYADEHRAQAQAARSSTRTRFAGWWRTWRATGRAGRCRPTTEKRARRSVARDVDAAGRWAEGVRRLRGGRQLEAVAFDPQRRRGRAAYPRRPRRRWTGLVQ